MLRFFQVAGLLACLGVAIGFFSFATAQPPASPAERKIRAALEGEAPSEGTGDGVLDDVIGIIQRRGSILQGSSLDPAAVADHSDDARIHHRSSVSEKAYCAEQLLKASRLLERVAAADDTGSSAANRAALVKRIRAEAGKLLAD